MKNNIAVVRGAGDLASGTIYRLHKSGFLVLALECEKPTSIRRKVCYSEAVFDGECRVEDTAGVLVSDTCAMIRAWHEGKIPVMVDPKCEILKKTSPSILIDAILAKKNLGTKIDMAEIVIGLGPGFEAGKDVDAVVETMRGHNLGRVIRNGFAQPNTGIPGQIAGISSDRVIYSPSDGSINQLSKIGDIVHSGDTIALVNGSEVKTKISGVLRGIIRDGFHVKKGLKIADVDPRIDQVSNCHTISDKARSIAGGVLESILYFYNNKADA